VGASLDGPPAEETIIELADARGRGRADTGTVDATASPDPAAFVRACLQLRHRPDRVETVRDQAGCWARDWDPLLAIARAERVGPLLDRALRGRDFLPAALLDAFHMDYRTTALRNRLLLDALAAVLRALADAGISVIVLKGAALIALVYREPALRPMVDVDVLVHAADRLEARAVLERLGYALSRAETRPGVLTAHESEIELRKPGPHGAAVDLHWSLFDSPHHQYRVDMAWFWRTAEPATIGGAPARVLGPVAQLLHLSGHLVLHHQGRGLLWWHDLAEVVHTDGARLDWDTLLAGAREFDLQLPLRRVLVELAAHWEVPVPAPVLERLRTEHPSRAEARLVAQLGTRPAAGRRFWIDLAGMRSWRSRWQFAAANLLPSAAYMRRRYGVRHTLLLPLYYPYRWLRGVFARE
jgi:hypothetical protein